MAGHPKIPVGAASDSIRTEYKDLHQSSSERLKLSLNIGIYVLLRSPATKCVTAGDLPAYHLVNGRVIAPSGWRREI